MKHTDWSQRLSAESALYHRLLSPLRLVLFSFLVEKPDRLHSLAELSVRAGLLKEDVAGAFSLPIKEGIVERITLPDGEDGYRLNLHQGSALLDTLRALLATHRGIIERITQVRDSHLAGMIGHNEKMKAVFELILTAARTDSRVLVQGELGTGLEKVAAAIHELSERRAGQFVTVDCSTLAEHQAEPELFGSAPGVSPGQTESRPGKLAEAAGGTLFLQEIGDLAPAAQLALAQSLENNSFTRLGEETPLATDFRLICASSKPLDQLAQLGEFREELYYRINIFPILLPSLRERREDIPDLAEELLRKFCAERLGNPTLRSFAPEALRLMHQYDWPGNIRQLEAAVRRMGAQGKTPKIGPEQVRSALSTSRRKGGDPSSVRPLKEVERTHIVAALRRLHGNMKRTAEALMISRVTLYNKVKEYRIAQREWEE